MIVSYKTDAIALLCYDIQPLIVEGIEIYANQNPEIELIGAFDNLVKFRHSLSQVQKIDVIIIGLLTAEGSIISLVEEIKKEKPKSILILYTIIESNFIITRFLEMGVTHVFHKRVSGHDLIQKVLEMGKNGQIKIAKEKQVKKKNNNNKLNEGQIILINLIAQGLSADQISKKLNKSKHTVNNQKNKLLKRFSCNNSSEFIVKMISFGYVKL